jgi:hypothetical protein
VPRGRKNADEALLTALACGATVENAAQNAGVSSRTAHRRLADPAFQERLQSLKADMVERTVSMLTAAGMESAKTLITLQDNSNPGAVRLGASRTVLELGMKLRETAELAARIAALEAQLGSTLTSASSPVTP